MKEILDIVDKYDNVIGQMSRDEVHSSQDNIHREINLIIFDKDTKEVLLAQRSLSKKKSPGIWDATVSGHVLAGEKPEDTAVRELKEELGLEEDPVLYRKEFDQTEREQRFYYLYYGFYQGDDFVLDPEEVETVVWCPVAELDMFLAFSEYKLDRVSQRLIKELSEKIFD